MPVFRGVAEKAAQGCLVKPILLDFFQRDLDIEITLRITRVMDRPYDGWFHSSVHPTQDDRSLWTYLAMPEKVRREQLGYIGAMSTMFGTVTGEVLKEALRQAGVSVKVPRGTCPACGLPQPSQCREHGARDERTRSRGHLDDIADFGNLGTWGIDWKTIRPYGLKDAPDMDEDFFRQRWPRYFGQAQDYMRMTGLRKFIVMFLGLGNPWELREYQFSFDPVYSFGIESKYLRVLQAYEEGRVL
jgi:hypothetical protein